MTRLQIGINDLATVNPELAAQWHPTKNGSLFPTMVTAGSNKRIWWCGPCGYEWEAVVHSRTLGRGCPYCANKMVLCGFNDLATYSPEIAAEWNNEMNASLRPSDVTYGSHQKVWWRCKDCGYEWQTKVRMRIRGTGCP